MAEANEYITFEKCYNTHLKQKENDKFNRIKR